MDKLQINKKEIKEYHKLMIISELAPIKEHVKIFEQKKACSFQEFEQLIKNQPENFSDWDDYIEWKAYEEKLKELESKIKKIEKIDHVEVID